MENLPPRHSARRGAAIAFWIVLTVAFAALLVYGVVRWTSGETGVPVLAAIGGIGSFIGIWRWIAESRRA